MERKLCGWGALVGIIASLILAPSYETSNFYDRGVIGCIMFATVACIAGYTIPLLPSKRND